LLSDSLQFITNFFQSLFLNNPRTSAFSAAPMNNPCSCRPGVPWCFSDTSVSLGGEWCPSDIPVKERVDCFPEPGASAAACVARGCFWCSSSPSDGTPWCFAPREQGYRVLGGIQTTAKGYTARLQRINTPSWYGSEFEYVTLTVEFNTESRLRIKVCY